MNLERGKVILTKFGKTKEVKCYLYNMTRDDIPEETLWVERAEDWYSLLSPQLKNKKVVCVERYDWLFADDS